jgi:polyphenol oxidase
MIMDPRYFEIYTTFNRLSGSYALTTTRAFIDEGVLSQDLTKHVFEQFNWDFSQALWPVQIHSGHVHFTRDSGPISACDGIVTDHDDRILLVCTADCVPVFLSEQKGKLRGLVHAGWRGLEKNIVSTTIELMGDKGADMTKIIAATGPSICADCYEVGPEVAFRFPRNIKNNNGKVMLDLQQVIRDQLLKSGVPEKNILLTNQCTLCQSKRYVSYRYNKTSNRLLSILRE